jgi:hypothetical protein
MTTKKGPPQPPAPPPRVRPIAPAPGAGRVPVIRPIPQRPGEARPTQRSVEQRPPAPPADARPPREPRSDLGRPRELGKERRPVPFAPATTMKSAQSPLGVREQAPTIEEDGDARATRDLGRGRTDRMNEAPPRDAGFPALARAIPEPRAYAKPRFPPPPTRLPSERPPPESKREDEPTKLRGKLNVDFAIPNFGDAEDRVEQTVVMADGPGARNDDEALTEVGMMPPDMADVARAPTRPAFEPIRDRGEATAVLVMSPEQRPPYGQRHDQTAAMGAPPVAFPPGYARSGPSVQPPPYAPPFAAPRARGSSMRVPHEPAPTTSPVIGFFLFAAPLALATLIIAALAIVL